MRACEALPAAPGDPLGRRRLADGRSPCARAGEGPVRVEPARGPRGPFRPSPRRGAWGRRPARPPSRPRRARAPSGAAAPPLSPSSGPSALHAGVRLGGNKRGLTSETRRVLFRPRSRARPGGRGQPAVTCVLGTVGREVSALFPRKQHLRGAGVPETRQACSSQRPADGGSHRPHIFLRTWDWWGQSSTNLALGARRLQPQPLAGSGPPTGRPERPEGSVVISLLTAGWGSGSPSFSLVSVPAQRNTVGFLPRTLTAHGRGLLCSGPLDHSAFSDSTLPWCESQKGAVPALFLETVVAES